MQDFDEWLGLESLGLNIADLRNHRKPIGFSDLSRLLTRSSQMLGKRRQHCNRHHGAGLPPSLSDNITKRQDLTSLVRRK